jgi:hypothetical protein
MERAYLLRNVENPTSVTQAAFLCGLDIERIPSDHFVHRPPTRLHVVRRART